MRKCIIIIITCWLSAAIKAQGQELTFLSPEVEEGIRQHLKIADEEQISFLQLDTITTLDLSRRGITDIHDLVLMPELRYLDLSDNQVEDLQPLTVLESLEWVDLSYNNLKTINDLFYASAKNLSINVAFNYIKEFSLFSSISSHNFTLEGTGLQLSGDVLYYDVNYLYTDINGEGQPVFYYRGYTNAAAACSITCGSASRAAQLDDDAHTVVWPETPERTTVVSLTNGEQSVNTYVVPPAAFHVDAGRTATLETGLPDDYYLYSAYASKGTVEIVGNTFKYTTFQPDESDVISFCYYQGEDLKGFSHYNLNIGSLLFGDVNDDGAVSMADVMMVMSYILGDNPQNINLNAADMNGDGEVTITDVLIMLDSINQP